MNLVQLCDLVLRYTSLESLDYGSGGQIYGTMEGTISGENLRGTVRLTNLAQRRPDNVNMPALRGILDTDDGAKIFIELDGIANLRGTDQARVFVTSLIFHTADPRYVWLNTSFVVVEGVLDSVAIGGTARCRAFTCEVSSF